MRKWVCITCGFVFDEALGLPEHGVPAGTRFEDLPEDWLCPECGSGKDYFEVMIE
ncbi:MAG: rubredoxin [Hyphomonadaceae bacterium]|nr:rubredoxin [Hyphomonadaceae bacterium]